MPGDPEIQALIDEKVAELYDHARGEAWRVFQRAPHALELDELHALALSGLAHAAARWESYCAMKGFDPRAVNFFGAYALRRMRGSMLDAMRQQDWVTRSARTKQKRIRDAGQDQGLSDLELAGASGLTLEEVRQTVAAVSSKPVSMDAEPHDVPDPGDVEGQAIVSSVLDSVMRVIHELSAPAQEALALHYYYGWTLAESAVFIDVPEEEAVRLFQDAVLRIHDAMLRMVT